MNQTNPTSDLQLLQNAPKRLLEKYYPLLQKVILLHTQKSVYGTLNPSELFKSVSKRLPLYLQQFYKRKGKKTFIKTLIIEACRMLCHHVEDLQLLQTQPSQLVIKYKATIYARIYTYVNAEKIREDQAEDVAQYTLEVLLKKLNGGTFSYSEGNALFRTYFHQTINNAIIDGIRWLNSKKASIGRGAELQEFHSVDQNFLGKLSSQLDLEKQSLLYGKLLQLYKILDRTKFELNTKVNYHILLQNKDVQDLPLQEEEKVELLVSFGRNFTHMSQQEVWKVLVRFMNLLENKSISADGLQKWFIRRRNWMIVKILYILNFDGRIQKKLTNTEKNILAKISTRAVGKLAEEYFGEVVYVYYR